MAARDLGPWLYTTGDGTQFRRRADKFITAQVDGGGAVKVGGATGVDSAVVQAMPSNYRPRMWHGSDSATGYKESVVIYTADAPLWTDNTVTVNVRDAGGTSHTLHLDARTGERTGRHISNAQ